MIPCAHSRVAWTPVLQNNAIATALVTSSSSCALLISSPSGTKLGIVGGRDSHGSSSSSLIPLNDHSAQRRRPARKLSATTPEFLSSVTLNSAGRCCCSSRGSASSQSDATLPKYHQNRRIELKRFRVIVQNGELRFRKAVGTGNAEVDQNGIEAQLSATRTRRDILVSSSSAALAVVNFLGTQSEAQASSVSQQVRLADVEDERLQNALRAAVSGDLENAETLFTELIKNEPASASGWSNRGSVRVSLGKFELAAVDFTKAIELAPEAPIPYLNRAISYEALGRYEEAIADCRKAIENDPEEPAAWFNLGNVEARVKDFDASLIAYQKASNLAPGIAGYRLRQALVLFQVGRLEESKKLLQGLVRKYPNYTEAHAVLAAVLWDEGQRSNAEEQFTEATIREPLYSNLSWVQTELQWPPGVLEAFTKFLSIDYSKSEVVSGV